MRMTKRPSLLYQILWLVPLGFMILALAALPFPAGAQDSSEGEAIFTEKCVGCHTVGGGDLVGPDLLGVTTRRDKAWLTRWIKEPDKMLAEGDEAATRLLEQYNKIPMPNLALTDSEVAALIVYFESVDGGSAPALTAAPAGQLPAGDSERGKMLFLGTARLSNGGPACMTCHSVAGIGALGGGALGPDLTDVFNRYGGQTGLAAFLGSPSTTTMNAVWAGQPVVDQERADLVAFFESTTVPARPAATLWTLAGLSVAGAALMIAAVQIWWRKRLTGVRQPMIARANARK